MTEDDALAWLENADVPCGTLDRLHQLVSHVIAETARQNLIALSTLPTIWSRHIVDSLQLLPLSMPTGNWIDVGSGAGFPGLAVAAARHQPTTLVEPRKLRAAFLIESARALDMQTWVIVEAKKVEVVSAPTPATVISARAVAPIDRLFAAAAHLADGETVWLLMKGAKARDELAVAQRSWQGDFRLVPSITDPAASIVVARNVRRRGGM